MPSSLTPQLKKLLLAANCYLERQGKGDHEFGIVLSPNVDLLLIILSNPVTQLMQL